MIHNTLNLGIIGPLITFFAGIIVFALIPIVGSNTKYQYRVMQSYLNIAFNKLTYGLLVELPNNKLVLKSPDREYELYKTTIDDTTYYWDDNAGLSKPFYGGMIGYTKTTIPSITTPRLCEVSERVHEKHQDDSIETIESEKERAEVLKRDMVVTKNRSVEIDTTIRVPKSRGLVSADPVGPVLNTNMQPNDIPIIDSFVKESQSLLSEVGMWEKANAIVSFMIGFAAIVFGYDIVAGGSGGGGASLPAIPGMLIGVLPL